MTGSNGNTVVSDSDGIPVIDMGNGDAGAELLKAFKTIGFATLTNHGISKELLKETFSKSRTFFELERDTKMKYEYQGVKSNRGYIAMGQEWLEHDTPDKKESFEIGKENEVGSGENRWPNEELPDFRPTMIEYIDKMDDLHLRIMHELGKAMKLTDEQFFVERSNEQHINLRLLHYPSVPRTDGDTDTVIRSGLHTDYGTITLLVQDEVGGLRAQKLDGTWVTVPPVSDSVVVNVGGMLERWTNNQLRSTPHQVCELESHEDSKEIPERYSMAFFCNANKGTVLDPTQIPECLGEDGAKYEPMNAHDYLSWRLSQAITTSDS